MQGNVKWFIPICGFQALNARAAYKSGGIVSSGFSYSQFAAGKGKKVNGKYCVLRSGQSYPEKLLELF